MKLLFSLNDFALDGLAEYYAYFIRDFIELTNSHLGPCHEMFSWLKDKNEHHSIALQHKSQLQNLNVVATATSALLKFNVICGKKWF